MKIFVLQYNLNFLFEIGLTYAKTIYFKKRTYEPDS